MERIYGGQVKDGAPLFWRGTGGQSLYSLKHSAGALVHSYEDRHDLLYVPLDETWEK